MIVKKVKTDLEALHNLHLSLIDSNGSVPRQSGVTFLTAHNVIGALEVSEGKPVVFVYCVGRAGVIGMVDTLVSVLEDRGIKYRVKNDQEIYTNLGYIKIKAELFQGMTNEHRGQDSYYEIDESIHPSIQS